MRILQLMRVFYVEKGNLAGKSGDDLADITESFNRLP
jgi:hypothetical protein